MKPHSYNCTWILFTRGLEAQYGKFWEQDYSSQLTGIKHSDNIEDYDYEFQVLATRVDYISDELLLEACMGGLKEDIKHEIFLKHHVNILEAMEFAHHIQAKNRTTHKSTTGTYVGNRDRFVPHRGTMPQPT
jgi:hypothetical protein